MKKRIVVFDEDLIYGSIIDQNLNATDSFVYLGWYKKFEELIVNLKKDRPDFLLMEVPREIDLSIIGVIKKNYSSINVVIISSKEDHPSILQAFRSGANGYLIKNLGSRETMEGLNKIAQGGVALSPSVARSIVKGFWKTNNSPLTRTETRVLKFISLGHTHTSLAKDMEISKHTAKTHVKNIYRKLNIHRKSEALERAYSERLIN